MGAACMEVQDMDAKEFLTENPDWKQFRHLILTPPAPELLMQAWPDVNPEVLARCREVVEDGIVTRGAIYWRVRTEERLLEADQWASAIALRHYPRSAEAQQRWLDAKEAGYLD